MIGSATASTIYNFFHTCYYKCFVLKTKYARFNNHAIVKFKRDVPNNDRFTLKVHTTIAQVIYNYTLSGRSLDPSNIIDHIIVSRVLFLNLLSAI